MGPSRGCLKLPAELDSGLHFVERLPVAREVAGLDAGNDRYSRRAVDAEHRRATQRRIDYSV